MVIEVIDMVIEGYTWLYMHGYTQTSYTWLLIASGPQQFTRTMSFLRSAKERFVNIILS